MSWGDGLQRLASAFGVLTSSIVTIPSPEQRILRLLSHKTLTARELASESRLPLKDVYSILGGLYERRAIETHPSGYFWVGESDLCLDRIFEDRIFLAGSSVPADEPSSALSA